MRVPRWLPGLAVGALLVGSGVAAAALTEGSSGIELADEPTTTLPIDSTTTTTVVVDEPSDEAPDDDGDDGAPADLGTERYWGPECGENPTNHGGYVRRAENNGTARSEAAHSPCGKPLTSLKSAPTTSTSAPDESVPGVEPETAPAPAPAPPGPPPNHGGGNGKGNGNAGGHGNGKGGKK